MNEQDPRTPTPQAPEAPRRRTLRRWGLIAALGTLAAGTAGWAMSQNSHGWHSCGGHGGPFGKRMASTPEAAAERADFVVRRALSSVGATEAQQTQATEIVRRAMVDAAPLREQGRNARARAVELLSAPQVDRLALEDLRVQQVAALTAASQRLTQALADVAEILTPEQRTALARKLADFGFRHG